MAKNLGLGTIAVFVLWEVTDFIVHGNLLMGLYAETASLWRPQEEMNMALMAFVVLVSAAAFTYIYVEFFSNKSMANAVKYGAAFGLAIGMSFAYGTYAVQPIPYMLALGWFIHTVVQGIIGGAALGFLVKD